MTRLGLKLNVIAHSSPYSGFTTAVCPFRGTVSSKLPTFRVSTRLWSFGQKPLKLIRTLWSGSSRTSTVLSTYLYDPVTLLTAIVFLDCRYARQSRGIASGKSRATASKIQSEMFFMPTSRVRRYRKPVFEEHKAAY